MNEPETTADGDGGADEAAAALYARYVARRAERARVREVNERVLAAIADEEASRDAAVADRSPEALYRRYRATRTAVPASTVDAIMASLQAEAEAGTETEVGAETGAETGAGVAAGVAAGVGTAAGTELGAGTGAGSGTAGREARADASAGTGPSARRPSLAGRLFRLPGTVLDALGETLRGGANNALARRAVPALALAVATVALVPFLVTRDGPSTGDGVRLAVLAPDTLLGAAERSAGYIDALPASGAAFAGEALPGVAFRLGGLVTDLAVAGAAADSPALGRVRTNLRFVARASGDDGVASATEALLSSAASPPLTREALAAPVEGLRDALVAASDGGPTGPRFGLGQAIESVALAARLAGDGGDTVPLRDTLAALAGVSRAAEASALPARARELLDELVALDGQRELDPRRAREIVATTGRLVLLLG